MKSFIFGADDLPKTPEELARMRAMAEALAPSRAPQNVGEGIASIGNAILYRSLMKKADGAENAGKAKANSAFSALIKPTQFPPAPAPDQSSPMADAGTGSYRDAIAGIESKGSGDYAAVGPTDPKMGRALGRYQVMEANIGPWSKEVLGREVTPEEFMANPQLQDQIFDGKFGSYVKQYGPEGAAQAWFGGPGSVGKTDRKDVLGTTVGDYGKKFIAGLGDTQPAGIAAQPGMAATASPALGYAAPQPAAPPLPPPVEVADASNGTPDWMNSPQLRAANPNVGILRVLTGGGPGTGMDQPTIDMNQAIQLMNDPYMDEGKRAVLQSLIGQEQKRQEMLLQQQDPKYQMDLRRSQLELQNLENPKKSRVLSDKEEEQMGLDTSGTYQAKPDGTIVTIKQPKAPEGWEKLDGNTLYKKSTGETKTIGQAAPQQGFRFTGNSVEAQALNGLLDSKALTEDQAMQLAAGKTISGPNGEIIFMTPQGVFSKQTEQQNAGGLDIFGGSGGSAPPAPKSSGMIPITAPKVTESEKNAMTYADRMAQAGAVLDEMGTKGLGLMDRVAGEVPLIGGYLTSDDYKKVEQAKRDFINAQLRRESGAAIGASEFESADKQYFPQPGDSEDLIKQKRRNRQTVIEGMKRDAGPTYKAPNVPTATPSKKAVTIGGYTIEPEGD